MTTLHIRQESLGNDYYNIRLTLKITSRPDQEAEAKIHFALTEQEQKELRWYLEDYLQRVAVVEPITVEQIEAMMHSRGVELYNKILVANGDTQAIWFAIRNDLANLRIEIATGVAEAASIPWELMRDPKSDSPISLRVRSFVRVQSSPNISFVPVPDASDGRIRLLYVACRLPGDTVELRAVANRLLKDLGESRVRFDIKALRPPTFDQLQKELKAAKKSGSPYHIVHFDGHGIYEDLGQTNLAHWAGAVTSTVGNLKPGKHGYLLFEHPNENKIRPVDGEALGKLLHDQGVPILVLNACQSAMQEATASPNISENVHDEVRAIGSLAQSVIDQGIPAVLGMRYSVYVVTAAEFIGHLYAELATGSDFGEAVTEGRKYLHLNPDRWIGLQPRPLQDWFVPVVHEAAPILLFSPTEITFRDQPELDPVQSNQVLRRYVPDEGFIGRDETLFGLDRAFDKHRIVLLHAYAGQGKSSTAVEFARWYAVTRGLGEQALVLFASFETHTDLDDLLNQVGQTFAPLLETQGIHWGAVNDPNKRRDLVLQVLRYVPILWIWDNVEPVAGFPQGTESQWTPAEQRELRDFLKQIKLDSSSKVKILLTSRRDEQKWLGGIPHRVAMPRMRTSDAAKLALKMGEDRGLTPSDLAEWQPLLDYCAGNPLTLRVLVSQAVRMDLRRKLQINNFVEAIRSGEQLIEDVDEEQGRDKSLGASLDYGFRNAFKEDELPIIALLHLFQGTVDVDVLHAMGNISEHALPELDGKTKEYLTELLTRAKETGLLTHLHATGFNIHPALPWFLRQLFARHYDGKSDRSTSQAAYRAWVDAVGLLSDFYTNQFIQGKRGIVKLLALEEANLLYARRLACEIQWWDRVISCMQGLRVLYDYQGRNAEWARLVKEINPQFCTVDDEPIPGREDLYSVVVGYGVELARDYEHDLAKAAELQARCVEFDRKRAAAALALPSDAQLDNRQRNLLQTLAISLEALGQIQRNDQDPNCVQCFKEGINLCRRIIDKAEEAILEFHLGHAYKDLPTIRDLNAAEAAYQRSLNLFDPNDTLARARCIKQIGMVHHERLVDGRKRGESVQSRMRHAQAAEKYVLEALLLYPKDALTDLGRLHGQLGNLYVEIGYLDQAREQYEQAAQYHEKIADRFAAGCTRLNMAVMYGEASQKTTQLKQRRVNLLRAQAYAEAALRDFKYYQGRAVADERRVQKVLTMINQDLAKLPQ